MTQVRLTIVRVTEHVVFSREPKIQAFVRRALIVSRVSSKPFARRAPIVKIGSPAGHAVRRADANANRAVQPSIFL